MLDIDKENFGAFIAELRKEKGITQKALAEQLFVSDKAVSKWETGSNVPDIALLIPLADILGVTVTELLMCKHMKQENTLDAVKVEEVVKTAISYSEEEQARTFQNRKQWGFFYVVALVLAIIEVFISYTNGHISPCMIVAVVLSAIFGSYFCFFAKTKLPTYYDGNRICVYSDGFFELNLPGLAFNNSNWGKILNVGRIWSIVLLVTYPIVSYIMAQMFIGSWIVLNIVEIVVALFCILGGLFIPMYIFGRKFE